MRRSLFATALCTGAFIFGLAIAEAQQFAPRARVQSGTYPGGAIPAGPYQAGNPGVQAQPGRTYAARPTVQQETYQARAQAGSLDAEIAAHLAIGNAEEIALSRYGRDRAESDEVHEFTEDMIEQHTDFLNRLRRIQPRIVAAYGRMPARTAAWEDDSSERRTTRRINSDDFRRDGAGRSDAEFRRGGSGDFEDDLNLRGSQRGTTGDLDADEADFRADRLRSDSSNRAGTSRTGTERRSTVGNSSDQPTGGDEDTSDTGPAGNNRTGTVGPTGTGAGSTGGIGTRTGSPSGASGTSGANTGSTGSGTTSGSGTTGGASGTGTSGSGTSGSSGAGAGGTGAGSSGAGAGGGAGAGSGGAGAGGAGSGGAGGSGGSGAYLAPTMKTYPVVFQAGSQDENEDALVPNRRRSGNREEEGTTIGPNQTGPRGGYNQESETQDGARSRSSRGDGQQSNARGGREAYDVDDYRDTRRGTSSTRTYRDDGDDARYRGRYDEERSPQRTQRYPDDYDTRAAAQTRPAAPQAVGVNPASLQFHQEVAERCLANTRRELEDKEGTEFDIAFMGVQIAAHNRMLSTLEAARRHASPQLAQLIDEGIQTTEEHLDHARHVMRDLEREFARTATRERSSSRQ